MMTSRLPTLSVVMPNRDNGHYIAGALEAILNQSYPPFEIVVVDDESSDDSVDVIEEIARLNRPVTLLKNERNLGTVGTINRGVKFTSGDYLFFPGSDDLILPGFFEKAMTLLAEYPEAGLCSARAYGLGHEGDNLGLRASMLVRQTPGYVAPEKAASVLQTDGEWFVGSTAIRRRDVFEELGGFHPELEGYADNFSSHVISLRYGACFIPEPQAMVRQGRNLSGRTQTDVNVGLSVMGATVGLMRDPYRDLFSENRIRDFENRWRAVMLIRATRAAQQTQLAVIDRVASDGTVADRLFVRLVRLLMSLEAILLRAWATARFRRGKLFSLRRIMKAVSSGMKRPST